MTDDVLTKSRPLLRHCEARLEADPKRTVLRPFVPGEPPEIFADKAHPRAERIVDRILSLDAAAAAKRYAELLEPLHDRHRDIEQKFRERYAEVAEKVDAARDVSYIHRLLIGAYFTEEYAFESTALFNPSIVRHPDQGGLADGDLRFILSLRGIGEGHLSSLTFRTGVWRADGEVEVDDASLFAVGPKLHIEKMSNDRIKVDLECGGAHTVSETVIYPFMPSQGRGIEDMRLVEFVDGDGRMNYRGTFTAFSGTEVRQGLIQTSDFKSFEMRGVEGDLYAGKGMALFPRMIGGRYAMLSRQDNEAVWLVFSDDLYEWNGGEKLLLPEQPWEYVQMGNCGSPIEIDEGFLVLTHGVGGVRTYCLGAALLDRDDPSRVIGRLADPLLAPDDERDGYVPNVIYSCGGLVRDRELLLPYAVADSVSRFAVVDIDELVARMAKD